jgi:hypothetical protein
MTAQEALKTALIDVWEEFYKEGLAKGVSQGFKERHGKCLSLSYACRKLEKTCKEIAGKHADEVFEKPEE